MKVVHHRAQALQGRVLRDRGGVKLMDQAVVALDKVGDVPGLAEACTIRAWALSGARSAEALFSPVRRLLKEQPFLPLAVEYSLADAAWCEAQGEDPATAYQAARASMLRIAKGLNDQDRAALRLHPWARRLRRAGIDDRFEG